AEAGEPGGEAGDEAADKHEQERGRIDRQGDHRRGSAARILHRLRLFGYILTMKFCPACASELKFEVPPADNRPRFMCPSCGAIHYQNPRIVTGTVPTWGDRILLCKRAIEPRYGFWTLPAGFMEIGETVADGA